MHQQQKYHFEQPQQSLQELNISRYSLIHRPCLHPPIGYTRDGELEDTTATSPIAIDVMLCQLDRTTSVFFRRDRHPTAIS